MEARLIGLGVSFTTCVNLYCDGHEFTRGNSINYWNNVVDSVLELPRPIRKCGIVYLKTCNNNNAGKLFRVRPDLVRRALCWLINNNPLYANVTISEENLAALTQFDAETDLPTVSLTDDEAHELVPQQNEVNQPRAEHYTGTQQSDHTDLDATGDENQPPETNTPLNDSPRRCDACEDQQDHRPYLPNCSDCGVKSNATRAEPHDHTLDPLADLVESFEIERNDTDTRTELQRIVEAANIACEDTQYPVKELQRHTDPIDEYKTKLIMQSCFPTLFPNGKAGYNALDGENRANEYHLAEFCAHLMKWHDRRFVIHGNFKFFCLNLIQRRQIDGLVRRVSDGNSSRDDDRAEERENDKDTARAIQLLES